MKRGGRARWNDETQRWEDGVPTPAPYTGPMPPRPSFTPSAGGPVTGGTPAGGAAGTVPPPVAEPLFAPDSLYAPLPADEPAAGFRHRTALVAGVAVAVIAAAAGGGYLLWGHPGDDPAVARPAARTKASASDHTATTAPSTGASSGASSGTGSPTPLSTELPDGYRLVHDEKGFTLAVPSSWQRSERRTGVFYTAPDDRGLLQIFEVSEPDTTPYEALETASRGLSGNPGYKEISLEPLGYPGPGADATQLVYAYDSERLGERVKVVDCAFTAADGRQFAVLVLGPEADWPEQEETQQNILRSFVPGR
ncbi:hypothetical protein RM550_18190 [Streptomyces sp. DSM 41527]|uniref:Serine/arginine repetitive matrix protein 2 n=1 Tax=Streptomyces mooreae TaxID=3075523 RepID=A0ABU2T9S0_9ACTN|nr:hypothetical protein [Streptomyces sp. DSM 41527]MDT0457645.1 hypothetical protein [Streptomyces sp. DSM 41527]